MVSGRVQALLEQLRAQGIRDEQVLNALAAVPREKFIDEAFEHKAWENIALPIGQGQTISQPYMVARMTELLELTPQSRVLEIGTGSGYQTAILAHLVHHVCSVERIKGLQWQARRRLKQLDLHNVSTRHGDGWQGWQARAPFDAIIVTAAPPENDIVAIRELRPQRLLIVDATDMGLNPGEIRIIDPDDIAEMFMMTTHNMPLNYLVDQLKEDVGEVIFVGIQPDIVGFYYPMTQPIKDAVNIVYQRLEGWQGNGGFAALEAPEA